MKRLGIGTTPPLEKKNAPLLIPGGKQRQGEFLSALFQIALVENPPMQRFHL